MTSSASGKTVEEFAGTTSLSAALRMAVDDMRDILRADAADLGFDMTHWVRGSLRPDGTPGPCTTCFVGAVMIERWNVLDDLHVELKSRRRLEPDSPADIEIEMGPTYLLPHSGGAAQDNEDDRSDDRAAIDKLNALEYARNGYYQSAVETGWPDTLTPEKRWKLSAIPTPKLAYKRRLDAETLSAYLCDLAENVIPKLEALGC